MSTEESIIDSEAHAKRISEVKCCCCLNIEKATKAVIFMVVVDYIYMFFWICSGYFFYRVATSKDISVGANGQIEVT